MMCRTRRRGSAQQAAAPTRHVRRGLLAATCGLLAAGLAGCTPTEPIVADQAVSHYDRAGEAVAASLENFGGPRTHDGASRAVRDDDGCRYTAGRWNPAGPLEGVSGDDGWDPVVDAASEAAQDAGFGSFRGPERSGAMYYVEATDDHGATLRIDGQGVITISGAQVDADECTEAGLGL